MQHYPTKNRYTSWTRSFSTNDNCTGCGNCTRICPVSNMALVDDKPSWLHHCEFCLSCFHWCPKEAIFSPELKNTVRFKTRRSIRKYKKETIPDDILKELLEACMSGPSGGNNKPWQFIVINDPKILEELPKVHSGAPFTSDAPLAILVCGDLDKYPGIPQRYEFVWAIDCSIAAQNIVLAAHSKGLGAVWTGVYPMEEQIDGLKTLLELPENIIPLTLIVIGYPREQLPAEDRYDASRVHYNKFWNI